MGRIHKARPTAAHSFTLVNPLPSNIIHKVAISGQDDARLEAQAPLLDIIVKAAPISGILKILIFFFSAQGSRA